MNRCPAIPLLGLLVSLGAAAAGDGNRLTYLDEPANPYYAGLATSRLTTPQWIGEEGVEAAVVLAVDDMSDAVPYEAFLRPILERLKQIDGRAPLSIMTKTIDPQLPQLQVWLQEGLSIETHTKDHPCPCLQGGNLAAAKATFDASIDQLGQIPGNRPVAFRMPCCDSMNSVSPRFFAEMFRQRTPGNRYLTIDTSVFMLLTADDPELPRELVRDADGGEKFRKYIPSDRLMVNYVQDYPYPYVVDRLCWEFPCLMPSDWDAQHRNGKCSPLTVQDLKAAVDAVVVKQGVFSLCFHPHGWLSNQQVVELVDYAATRHGNKVKFLSFRDVQQRLDQHLLGGQPLRAADGRDNGVRVCDLNRDGLMDVIVGNEQVAQTRLWSPATKSWTTGAFPTRLVATRPDGSPADAGVRFGVLQSNGFASMVVRNDDTAGVLAFRRRNVGPRGCHGLGRPRLQRPGLHAGEWSGRRSAAARHRWGWQLRADRRESAAERRVRLERQRLVAVGSAPSRGFADRGHGGKRCRPAVRGH